MAVGRLQLDRAITLETLERQRGRGIIDTSSVPPVDAQCAAEVAAELAVRRFYDENGLLSQPDTLHHYHFRPLPDYLVPVRWLGVNDDLTDPDRVDEDGVSYVPEFPGVVPYFNAANALDRRSGIVHEGAHYQQLSISFRHDRPLRRHYYDSGANEGIAFYNEELMLASGLFDDQPISRTIMYNFMGGCEPYGSRSTSASPSGSSTSLLRQSIWRRSCRWMPVPRTRRPLSSPHIRVRPSPIRSARLRSCGCSPTPCARTVRTSWCGTSTTACGGRGTC